MISRKYFQALSVLLLSTSVSLYAADPIGQPELKEATYSFKRPVSPYIIDKNEVVVNLNFAGGDVSQLQSIIDKERAKSKSAVIVVKITGDVSISDSPMTIGSNTCLHFTDGGKVSYSGNKECDALIHINRAENVSISSDNIALLSGKDNVDNGILVSNSGRVNIDNLEIQGFKDYGINYQGRGDDQLNEAGSITRCLITDCEDGGIKVRDAARFLAIDNTIRECEDYGMNIVSKSAIITGNKIVKCETALQIDAPKAKIEGTDAVIARNFFERGELGLELGANSTRNMVTENTIQNNKKGILILGNRNLIFNNTLNNQAEVEVEGSTNIIERNVDLLASDVVGGKNTRFFNPPTSDNPHKDQLVVMDMGRKDINVSQGDGDEDVDLKNVQILLDNERENNPNDYIVLWLKGRFVAKGEYTGLDLPENTSVVLDGLIYPQGDGMDRWSKEDHYLKLNTTGGTQLVLMKNKGYTSFSGGTIDCRNLSAYGIYAPGKNIGLIDGVTIHAAVDNNIGTIFHTGDDTPMFIRGCDFNGFGFTNRAVWVHVCNNVHCIDNTSKNHFADFVDIDAGGNKSTVLFNTTYNEKRCGVFIEENACDNIVLGNLFMGDTGFGAGVSLYSSIQQLVKNNILVGNTILGPYGINVRHARNTLTFNNYIEPGKYGVYLNAEDNYSAQNWLKYDMNMSQVEDNYFFCTPNLTETK